MSLGLIGSCIKPNGAAIRLTSLGGITIVVNKASVNRDRMFASMTEAEWDTIMAVHLKGHFCITSHAVHYWRDQSKADMAVDARSINTTSGAGLQGSIADGWRTTQGVDKGARWEPAEITEAMKELLAKEVPAQKVYGS